MLYLLTLPVIFLAVIVKLVSNRYKLKLFSKICSIIIFIGVVLFIYLFARYKGFDIIEIVYNFLFTINLPWS